MNINLFKKDKSVEDAIKTARQEGFDKAEIHFNRELELKLDEKKDYYELKTAELQGKIYSLQLMNKRIIEKYDVTRKKENSLRQAEKKLKFYAHEIATVFEEYNSKMGEGYQDVLRLKAEIDSLLDGNLKQLEDRK